MYITINDIKGEKRIDLSYPIYPKKEAQKGPAPQKLQLLACLAIMLSTGYMGL